MLNHSLAHLPAHPKARLLIYHAGSAGIHEAINQGVPMLLMPLGGDQPPNAHLVAAKGMGLVLDVNDLDENRIRTSINTLLNDERYVESCLHRCMHTPRWSFF